MSRIHGRNGRVYLDITGSGSAAPLPFTSKWSLNAKTDKAKVTAMGDDNQVYVAGLPDAAGNFSFFYDDQTAQTYTAASDGLARKFYLYPSILTNTQYWFGTILPDFNIEGAVDGPVSGTADWAAASKIAKVG